MEHICNNEPSMPGSCDQTTNISSNVEKEHEPEHIIDPEEIDDLLRQFES